MNSRESNRLVYRNLNTVTDEELQSLMRVVDGEVKFNSIERNEDHVVLTYPVTLGNEDNSFIIEETVELYPDEILFPWGEYHGETSTNYYYQQWLIAYGFSTLLIDNPFLKNIEK